MTTEELIDNLFNRNFEFDGRIRCIVEVDTMEPIVPIKVISFISSVIGEDISVIFKHLKDRINENIPLREFFPKVIKVDGEFGDFKHASRVILGETGIDVNDYNIDNHNDLKEFMLKNLNYERVTIYDTWTFSPKYTYIRNDE